MSYPCPEEHIFEEVKHSIYNRYHALFLALGISLIAHILLLGKYHISPTPSRHERIEKRIVVHVVNRPQSFSPPSPAAPVPIEKRSPIRPEIIPDPTVEPVLQPAKKPPDALKTPSIATSTYTGKDQLPDNRMTTITAVRKSAKDVVNQLTRTENINRNLFQSPSRKTPQFQMSATSRGLANAESLPAGSNGRYIRETGFMKTDKCFVEYQERYIRPAYLPEEHHLASMEYLPITTRKRKEVPCD